MNIDLIYYTLCIISILYRSTNGEEKYNPIYGYRLVIVVSNYISSIYVSYRGISPFSRTLFSRDPPQNNNDFLMMFRSSGNGGLRI